MLTAEQLETRRTGITATDIVSIAGVSPYGKTPHDVYLDKMGLSEPFPSTMAMDMGNRLEPVALALLADTCGLTLRPGKTERHPILTWVLASPDADVLEGGARVAVAEAKAVGLRMAARWGESGDPEAIPDEVRVQTQWQMVTTRTQRAHVVALLGTEARFYEIASDEDLASALLEMGQRFWTRHVMAKVAPPVDGSEGSARMVRGLFRKPKVGIVAAPPEAEELVRSYLAAKAAREEIERTEAAARAKLCALIGEHEGLESPVWRATWSERAGSPDWKAMAEKLGATKELAEQYRRGGTRVLNVKEKRA